MKITKQQIEKLTALALQALFAGEKPAEQQRLKPLLASALEQSLSLLPESEAQRLLAEFASVGAKSGTRSPPSPGTVDPLLRLIGVAGLLAWASERHPRLRQRLGADGLGAEIVAWLDTLPPDSQTRLLEAGVRITIQRATPDDQTLLQNSLGQRLAGMEAQMATANFVFDLSRLPQALRADSGVAFKTAVDGLLNKLPPHSPAATDVNARAAVVGMLLLDEQFNFTAPLFSESVRKVWEETLDTHKTFDNKPVRNVEVYDAAVDFIVASRALPNANTVNISYQEFAFASRHAIQNVRDNPPPGESFRTQVKIGLERFVAGRPAIESLELPPLTGADGGDVEIEPENIRAVALVYAAVNLEEMRMFHVVDRITEIFNNGQLPVGFDSGGRALDAYYFDREDRLNEAERRMVYSRVLGASGGMVSKEVQPNTQFDGLWIRFLSSLAEFDRQQRVDEIISTRGPRPQNLTGEYVRKAGRDLAANVSLYGWGGTHFAARRINGHIVSALDILNQPSIQKAYGVTNQYQLVERVASAEFGVTPNIVRLRTMADAGNKILNIVAKYHNVWTRSNGKPLFEERTLDANGRPTTTPGDILLADRDELMNQTQLWLAVNGIKDDQVDKMSQPEQARYEPSIPTFAGMLPGGNGAARDGKMGADTMERLKQMVMQGQTPSLDQLKQMLPM